MKTNQEKRSCFKSVKIDEQFKDNIKSRNIFYDLLRKIKHKYYNKGEIFGL